MTDKQKHYLKDDVMVMLAEAISSDYIEEIADNIIDDVAEDLDICADREYNDSDVRLAISRVLMDRLGLQH